MNKQEAERYINKLTDDRIEKHLSLSQAQKIFGGKRPYDKFYKTWGPGKKGSDALLAEKGARVFILNKVAKKADAAQYSAESPTSADLENTREKKKLADISFWLSIVLTAIFFFIGSIPNFDYWVLKLILAIGAGITIYWVYCRITRFLVKVT